MHLTLNIRRIRLSAWSYMFAYTRLAIFRAAMSSRYGGITGISIRRT